ncbi:hypothetical protein NG799_10320 [Laspinema sp. D1]|uniref:Uncharacterized protein n=1 Tax=Laspinema palackyanum D2a TaxID=2953684 RepID=A0ABT2MT71_9CYAN|nr:hypothetical protein [Laspinema sp. D2b]MCT7966726.1 hypothetical protein [Laspinema sp. D2a]
MSWDTLLGDRLLTSPAVSNRGTLPSETARFCQETLNLQAIACYPR